MALVWVPLCRHMPIVQLVVGGVNADWRQGVEAMRKQADEERP